MWQQADAPADAAMAALIADSQPEAVRKLFDTLISKIEMNAAELPPQVNAFIAAHSQLPAWADSALIEKGQKLFFDHGPAMVMILFYKSLPMLYTGGAGVKVLASTGRLMHKSKSDEIFVRRLAETGQFLVDVMTPGGLVPGGRGFTTALRVRLIHACIRTFLLKGHWDSQADGQPINQEELGLTLMTFSIALTDGLRKMGYEVGSQEEEAYIHCWNVVGHLMGVDAKLLPNNAASARALAERVLERRAFATEDGVKLTQAILSFSQQRLPGKVLDQAPAIMIRFLCGDKTADMLGVKVRAGCLGWILPRFIRLWAGWIDRLEDHHEGVRKISDRLSMEVVKGIVTYFNQYKGKAFDIPELFQKRWGM